MSKNIFVSILLSLLMVFSSCQKVQKDVYDYYPKVSTLSATVLPDGTVELKGEIIDNGTTDIEYAGFCMDTLSNPEMLSNQLIATSIQDNIFTVIYSGFNPYKRYYFRSWATNDLGYSYGDVVSLDSIHATPVVAPCNPTLNTINIGGGQPVQYVSTVTAPAQGFNEWDVDVSTSGGTFNFTFGSKPTTKIYTVSQSLGPDHVTMNFYSGFITGSLSDGGLVYVNQTAVDQWTITLCDDPWVYQSSTFYMNGKFDCPK